jgi:hypothetical protein
MFFLVINDIKTMQQAQEFLSKMQESVFSLIAD